MSRTAFLCLKSERKEHFDPLVNGTSNLTKQISANNMQVMSMYL